LLFIRSIVFNVVFYVTLVVMALAALPTLLMPRWGIIGVARLWGRINLWLLRVICGIKVDYRGIEKIPPGAILVASKHQSLWETFALVPLFPDPSFIVKRELSWIPVFGWHVWRAEMTFVDRGARSQALAKMTAHARIQLQQGRQIVIFPEGTRRAPGAEPAYKYGVVHLYAETGVACVPIALNSGLFWPRRKFVRYPGTVTVEILDPIPPGLDKKTFAATLQDQIETATTRLLAEGAREAGWRA
jgi:1-acyl-sn-glycerol-3-phosphate acyltransferase